MSFDEKLTWYPETPASEWPRPESGQGVAMFNAPLDLDALLDEAE